MKKNYWYLNMVLLLSVICCLQIHAKEIIPFYETSHKEWKGKCFSAPIDGIGAPEDWYKANFDDSSWDSVTGPLHLSNGTWQSNYYSYWVRCHFTLDNPNSSKTYSFFVLHDDGCVAYLNGIKIYDNDDVVYDYTSVSLSAEAIESLHKGDNVLCVYVSDTGGGDAFMDFGLYENDLNDIVNYSDVNISFTNDEMYPWSVSGNEAQNGNKMEPYSTSWLKIEYSSALPTELKFDWYEYNYYQHQPLQLYIDGVLTSSTSNSSWTTGRFYLEPGNHVIAFRDSIGNYSNSNNRSAVRNISVKEIKKLETAVLSDNSLPLTFTNDKTWPWTIEEGYIQNTNYGIANSSSKFSTTFTIDNLSKLSFERRVGYWNGNEYTSSSYSYHRFKFFINGQEYYSDNYVSSFGSISVALEPGTYTMEWQDTIYNTTSNLLSQIRNIELSSNWIDVELATTGSLGVEVLYKVDVLTDVELLKVKGTLNSTDWTNIKQMKNLLALDLTEAKFDAVPNYAFDGLSRLSNVKLPEGVNTIGEYAFRGTQIWNIDIPNSVTSIGQYAFASTRIESVNFGKESKLQTIGYNAFRECTLLQEFIMPNTVTKLGTYNNYSDRECNTFYGCTNLKKIYFSDALTTLEQSVCNNCTKLSDVHLPQSLLSIRDYAFYNNSSLRHIDFPQTLERIDYEAFSQCGLDSVLLPVKMSTLENYAFRNCDNLTYIELPSYIGSYDNNFYECSSVQKVVCQSATPPSIKNDPFSYGRDKSDITLVVPSFAVVNYKLNTYWYQFGSIVEGDDIDYWKITSALSLTNNRRMNGKPDIDLYYDGQLTVGGNAPMTVGQMDFYFNESNPGRLLNDCTAMTADGINSYFSVSSEKWYFISPLHDVSLTKVSVSNDASYVFRYYDGSSRATNGTGNSWRNVDNGKLIAGQGYIFRCNKDAVLKMPAEATGHAQILNTKDVTKSLSAYEATTTANKSWNYVGNPYPVYYDIYYMDFTAPITVWTGSTYKAYSIADDDFVLRPMQAFFVQKPDAVDNIVFHKEGRQLTSSIERASYVKAQNVPSTASRFIFNIQISNEEMSDETRVVINQQSSLDYEIEHDASKFMSIEASVPQIFSLGEAGVCYAINERPLDDGKVKLAYYAGTSGFFTISATRADGDIYLQDNLLNKTINLSEQDYTFYSEKTNGTDNTRFMLNLNASGEETDITSVNMDTEHDIYDITGHKLNNINNHQKGLFIEKDNRTTRKVLVR